MVRKYSESIPLAVFLVLIFFVLPLVKFSSTIDPELAPRFLITSVFVFICAIYLIAVSFPKFTISKNARLAFGIVTIILAWMGLSIVQSVNPGDAFTEWLRLAVIYSVFFISFILFKNSRNVERLICRAAGLAIIIFSVYGFIQFFQVVIDHLDGKRFQIEHTLASSLANKNFFSEVLVLFLPFLINGILHDKKWRIYFILTILPDLFFIALLQTIAVWIAIGVSIIFLLIISARKKIPFSGRKLSPKKIIAAVTIFVILISATVYFYSKTFQYKIFHDKVSMAVQYVTNPEKLSQTSDENNNSVFERLVIWRNSWRMIKDHPLAGAGLNNWKLYDPSYGIGGTRYSNTGMINYEHPHNDYLLVLAEQGPAGIILYLMLFILIIREGIRKINSVEKEKSRFLILLLSGVISFMTISMLAYPRSRFYSMIILMIIFALILNSNSESNKENIFDLRPFLFGMLPVSVFATIASSYRISGETHMRSAMVAQVHGNYVHMMREADKAYSWYFPLDLTSTPISWYKGLAWFYSGSPVNAVNEYEKAVLVNPNHLRTLNDLATSLEQSGDRARAIYIYNRALAITPQFIEGAFNLSAAYYNTSKFDSALIALERISSADLTPPEQNHYDNFLQEIIYARSYEIIYASQDSSLIKQMPDLIKDKKELTDIYKKSKSSKRIFADSLTSYFKLGLQ